MRLRLPLQRERAIAQRGETVPNVLLWGPVGWSLEQDLARYAETWWIWSNRTESARADIIIFHIPLLARMPPKRPGQIWVGVSMESDVNYPVLRDSDFMAQFDYSMTYRRDSDFPMLYPWEGIAEALRRPTADKDGDATAVYFASSGYNESRRTEYVTELMHHIDVASFGRVLNNRHLDQDEGWQTKLSVIARYPFTLAFENSVTGDYVTEKFYQPLVAGSVPVYLGAPNVADFAPGERCYIDVTDFDGPQDLAGYLSRLLSQREEFLSYLAWKAQPFRREFLDLLALQTPHPVDRLCRELELRLANGGASR